ncbi:MAG TPA: DUF5615 family PIN-like protein [Tepidisphaeraceae bacterium]|nr:DUF5615 family PIN-like protein [Tepidisphaeraceae bacterium]
MARFYSNETFPLAVVEELRRLGHDVLTSLQAGRANQSIPDHQVLAFAIAEKRAVLTFYRRHFARLYAQSAAHASIVSCTVDADYNALARRIDQAVTGRV